MDELDRVLLGAWWEVWGRCRGDLGEARRRWVGARRWAAGAGRGAVRGWCLSLRASDTRIGRGYGWVGSSGPRKVEASGATHRVAVTVGDVMEWCRPVRLAYPGVPIQEAADRLGRHVETVRNWLPVRQGREREDRLNRRVTREADYGPRGVYGAGETGAGRRRGWGVRYEEPRYHGKHQGGAVPVVWHEGLIDPGHQKGVGPGPAWGGWWESMAGRWAAGWGGDGSGGGGTFGAVVFEAERVARWRERTVRYRDGDSERRVEFRGWEWVCPGRPGNDEARMTNDEGEMRGGVDGGSGGCGRRCGVLVCPLVGWTIGGYLADRPGVAEGLEVLGLPGVGEAERWRPGFADAGGAEAGGAERSGRVCVYVVLGGAERVAAGAWGVERVCEAGERGALERAGRGAGGT